MDKLVTRLKAEKSRNDAEIANQIEEQRQRVIEAENLRVERLKEMISNWLEVMSTAGYPHAELLTRHSQEIKKGLFGSRIETYEEEAAGWLIGQISEIGGPDLGSIYLIVDGRLLRGFKGDLGSPYQLGFNFETEVTLHTLGYPSVDIQRYEEQIPNNLKAIAKKAGLDWNPDEVVPNSQEA